MIQPVIDSVLVRRGSFIGGRSTLECTEERKVFEVSLSKICEALKFCVVSMGVLSTSVWVLCMFSVGG